MALAALLAACTQPPTASGTERAASTTHSTPPASGTAVATHHDPANPPIDCPLRKAGVDPNGLKPFEDVEKYIAFLERPDRATWQKPDTLVASLGLAGSETVVDVGAGSGYFTFPLAKALLDIKPFVPDFDHRQACKTGWYPHGAEPGAASGAVVAHSRFEPMASGVGATARPGSRRGPWDGDG